MDKDREAKLKDLARKIGILSHINQKVFLKLDEALTHISAGSEKNHEQLEFLGDAVLRLVATEFIAQNHSDLSVGESSKLRANLVSDRWLAEVGDSLDLEQYMLLGRHAENDISAKQTLFADVTEALIGALYLSFSGFDEIHRWLTPHWLKTVEELKTSPHLNNSKTNLQEWSQGLKFGLPTYTTKECSRIHGDPKRFTSLVSINGEIFGEAFCKSRKEAEQNAASRAMNLILKRKQI